MQHRSVGDVMTREVVTARPDTPFKEVAALFHRNDITAIPVIDDQGRPLGMVSEADLLRKEAVLPDPEGRFPGRRLDAGDRARAEAETAGGLMTSPAVTARPGWSVPEAARAMDKHRVKRLPVVDEAGRLVGIVSRRDLLEVFLRHDAAIRDEINHDVLGQTLWLTPGDVVVGVHEGVVTLRGRLPRRSLIPITEQLCRAVDGVVAVHAALDWTEDDTDPHLEHPRAYRAAS
ncbi:inosine-5'-monophosphate dehydrogenase [Kitasatospora aureofaciens]|uniref:Inosine-5'-monophosphate dehydrogenase n=1 Tax=Kitasatospora aureofaciens TaxID=1894 RepID=A0A1E7NFW4_KITAU|nr:CBS domain-containing protein [Kitasatospora aureofaciens]OEV39562.1 inosine-5'-monophosphate dehydrogenase [Kitasatospora aureofaciens]